MDGETCVPRLKPIGPAATSMSGAGMRAERPDTVHDRIEAGEDLLNPDHSRRVLTDHRQGVIGSRIGRHKRLDYAVDR